MPDITEDVPSFGWVFERLEQVQKGCEEVMRQSTEFYEKRLADEIIELKTALDDVVIILRDHLACHDCPDEEVTDGKS